MQIILNREECEVILDALITELEEMKNELKFDQEVGRDLSVKLDFEYIEKIEQLIKRFEPYLSYSKSSKD